VDQILGRCRATSGSDITVDQFGSFFIDKIMKIRDLTAVSPPPVFSELPSGAGLFSEFAAVSADDVIAAIDRLPDKASAADPIPTSLLRSTADLVAPYVAELFNRSLSAGHFSGVFKHAFITPIIKKPGMDSDDVGSYRPISNLSVLSKLFERIASRQLTEYLQRHHLLPPLQSGFRAGHSTETAVLHVLSEILSAVDAGNLTALVLLDLSAAFDTVDHAILLERLRRSFGVDGAALRWFSSYLTGRTFAVRRGGFSSTTYGLQCGVPQGSVLGPLLFILYTADLPSIVRQHGLTPHLYADDTQIYSSCRPADAAALCDRLGACVSNVAGWMASNRLQLNQAKTEIIWCCSVRRQFTALPLVIGNVTVHPSTAVRDLGVMIDADLTLRVQVSHLVAKCFGSLRQLRSVRQHVSASVMRPLVTSLILTRLDYCNSIFNSLPAVHLRRLQSVQNAAARLVFNLRRSDDVSDALVCLHWLRVRERIAFKTAVLVYRCLHGAAPPYLADFQRTSGPGRPARRPGLRSADVANDNLIIPRSRCVTIGPRAFSVAGASIWNGLPADITSAPSLTVFRRRLKTYLFTLSFPGAV
jgi:hypothetical protein